MVVLGILFLLLLPFFPTPVVNPEPDQILCVNTFTNAINFSGTVNGSTYNWTSINGSSIGLNPTSGSNTVPAFNTINTSPSSIVAQILVTPIANGCSGVQDTIEITVIDPLPIITPTPDADYCSGNTVSTIAFSGNNPSIQYNWTTNNTSIGTGLAANGTGSIPSFTAAIVTAPQTAEFVVTPTIGSCQGIADTFYLTINPTPNVYNPGNQELCANDQTNDIIFFGDLSGTSFDWNNTNSSIGISGPLNGDILSFTALNSSNIAQTDTITVTPSLNGCFGFDSTFVITVNPVSTVNVNDFEYCHGDVTTAINFSGNNPASTFDWTNPNITISAAQNIINGVNTVPSFTANNTSLVNQVANFHVIPMLQTGSMNCPGDTSFLYYC